MLQPGRNYKAIPRLNLARRLALNQQLALAFHDVADLLARMCVAARCRAGSNLDVRDHGLAARNRYVRCMYDGAFQAGVLRQERPDLRMLPVDIKSLGKFS